jgi:hypothetical protein
MKMSEVGALGSAVTACARARNLCRGAQHAGISHPKPHTAQVGPGGRWQHSRTTSGRNPVSMASVSEVGSIADNTEQIRKRSAGWQETSHAEICFSGLLHLQQSAESCCCVRLALGNESPHCLCARRIGLTLRLKLELFQLCLELIENVARIDVGAAPYQDACLRNRDRSRFIVYFRICRWFTAATVLRHEINASRTDHFDTACETLLFRCLRLTKRPDKRHDHVALYRWRA